MGKLRTFFSFVVIGITLVIAAIISIQNIDLVTVNVLTFSSIEITSGLVIIIAFAMGFILSVLLVEGSPRPVKSKPPKKKVSPPRSSPPPMDYPSMRDNLDRSQTERQYDWSDPTSKEW